MIAIVPIAIGVPAVVVFVPPAVVFVPATFTSFPKLMTRVVRLPAVPAMTFDSFVQLAVGLEDTPLAMTVVVSSTGPWCGRESEQADESRGGEKRPSQKLLLSPKHDHLFSPSFIAPTGIGCWSRFDKTRMRGECSRRAVGCGASCCK